ncbi:DUF3244 domain-containing protein [Flammeovirga sp. EKP202]|uniref:DUF3244 domain-containing protein n=1 Tax=Flammeovirga sp. EKP202 TaxID=2770592 RepID=UPI00165F0BC4|nr:DUF3244 domain-containing protein [Flammeovirga sp. EKP202]MBD0403425.1 DUF3244 domain-containing protein [Flammeovirga sp. EKP202]
MKKLTILIVTLLLNVLSFASFANDISYAISVKKSVVAINFSFSSLINDNKDVKIKVLDDEGHQFLEENLKVNASTLEEIDMSSLEKGTYVFKMTFEDKVVTREFKLSKSKRVSMRDYTMHTKNRGFVVKMQGTVMKVETTSVLTENVNLVFKSPSGDDELLYETSFLPGENAITSIDLRSLGVTQFILNVVENDVIYSDRITMF